MSELADQAKRLAAQEALLDAITTTLSGFTNGPGATTARGVCDLAEAYAWLAFPAQPHGGARPAAS